MGLKWKFLLLAILPFDVLVFCRGQIHNHALVHQVIEGSLEIAKIMVRSVLLSVMGNEPIKGYVSRSLQIASMLR